MLWRSHRDRSLISDLPLEIKDMRFEIDDQRIGVLARDIGALLVEPSGLEPSGSIWTGGFTAVLEGVRQELDRSCKAPFVVMAQQTDTCHLNTA